MTTTIAKSDPRRRLPGVRLHGAGWQVYRQVRGKLLIHKPPMPLESTVAQLSDAWEALGGGEAVPGAGSLAEAVVAYVKTITAKPTAGQIARHLELALAALGRDRAATSIRPMDIDRLIDTWKLSRPIVGGKFGRRAAPRPIDGETIRKRLAHLQSFFKAVLPEGAANPVQRCKQRPKPKKAATRGVPMADVARILAAMPDERDVKEGAPRLLALGKIRATVTAYTGLDPAQIKGLKPGDLDLEGQFPHMRVGRDKGDGTGVLEIELIPAGLEALRAFVAAQAWGPYAEGAVNRSIKKAAASVGFPLGTFRQKDLRHSFLTEIYRISHDSATVARFAGHCPGSPMTARYTRAAHQDVDRSVAKRFIVPTIPRPATVLRLAGRKGRR